MLGDQYGLSLSTPSQAGRDACVEVADKKPAPILYVPADPQCILFVDALLNVSPEYEQ